MIHKCTAVTSNEMLSQTGGKQQDKRQWAENDAQEVLGKYEEELLYCEVTRAPAQIAWRGLQSSLLEIFKNHLSNS